MPSQHSNQHGRHETALEELNKRLGRVDGLIADLQEGQVPLDASRYLPHTAITSGQSRHRDPLTMGQEVCVSDDGAWGRKSV